MSNDRSIMIGTIPRLNNLITRFPLVKDWKPYGLIENSEESITLIHLDWTKEDTNMRNPEEYLAIRWWHETSGSMNYYIVNLQQQAVNENAPLLSVFKRFGGKKEWVILPDNRRAEFSKWLAENRTAIRVQEKHGWQSVGDL